MICFPSFLPPFPPPLLAVYIKDNYVICTASTRCRYMGGFGEGAMPGMTASSSKLSWVNCLSPIRCHVMRPTADNTQNVEVIWLVGIGNATEVSGTEVLRDTGVCLNVATAWMWSQGMQQVAPSFILAKARWWGWCVHSHFPRGCRFGSCSTFEMDSGWK